MLNHLYSNDNLKSYPHKIHFNIILKYPRIFVINLITVSSSLYYIIYLRPDDGLIGAETCSQSDK
jgi:hypothetical protein